MSEVRKELSRIIGEAIGEASVCWENPGGAGVFQSEQAAAVAERVVNRVNESLDELVSALVHTVEYAAPRTDLPLVPGWSWWDALTKYDPTAAQAFLDEYQRPRTGCLHGGQLVFDKGRGTVVCPRCRAALGYL